MHSKNNRDNLSIGQIGIELLDRGGKCGDFLYTGRTKTPPVVRFGYNSINSIWQGFIDEDRTFYSVTENDIAEANNA